MKLYKLNLTTNFHRFELTTAGMVRANDEQEARQLMKSVTVDDGSSSNEWLDPHFSSCEEIKVEGKSEVISISFNPG